MRYVILAAALALGGAARAGHEFPFYPSFYPQEITVEALDARTAAQRLSKGTLHAYVGAELPDAERTGVASSLGGYVVARSESGGCPEMRAMKALLPKEAVWHPYPVTPFHADYLYHADLPEIAKPAGGRARVEVVDLNVLMARASRPIRQGWFHAYLLLADSVGREVRAKVDSTVQRVIRGEYRSLAERIELERNLVALLQSGCERVVLGYTVRRERYGADYSQGVENVGYDALEGLASPMFPRTVKLRDFPWNGWLNLAVPKPPASAWNPVAGGFGDPFGRLVWSAVSDPAFLPAPHGAGWIENRVSADVQSNEEVPRDALFSGGRGKANLKITYRVRSSAFHDGTSMGFADVVYAYALAKPEHLKGVRLLRVETQTLAFGEDKLSYEVPVIEVYLDGAGGAAPGDAATAAPPWTTLPWHLLALYDEAARRGYLKLADFDPVRDAALVRRLAELARELAERGQVPRILTPYVNAQQAKERYARLREFHAAHGHWLVTNGPYLLGRWDGAKAVLNVFRDPTYPKGLGSFNAYAVPLKAHVTRVERRGEGAVVHTETEWLERLGRDTRIVRGSFAQRLAERMAGAGAPPAPVCRYVLVRPDGGIAAAGEVRAGSNGVCQLGLAKGSSRLMVTAVLEDNAANVPIKIVPWE